MNCSRMLFLVVITMVAATISRADELEIRLRSEYPSAAKRLEEAASRVRCEVECRLGDRTERDVIYTRGESILVERLATANATDERYVNKVQCFTPTRFFALARISPKSPLVLKVASTAQDLDEIERARLSIFTEAPRAAFCVDGLLIRRLVTSASFKIERIGLTDKGGTRAVEVEFQCNDPDIWVASGRLAFRPDLSWALAGYELKRKAKIPTRFPKYDWIAGKVTCREWSPGLVLAAESESRTSHDRGAKDAIRLTVLDASFKDVPESQFKISAYGLPDLPDVSRSPARSLPILMLGIILAVITLLFTLRSRQGHQPPGKSPSRAGQGADGR